jgi:hypothetical protein
MKNSFLRLFATLGLLFLLWVTAIAVRRAVFHQQTRTLQDTEAPFLMESALQFRMTRMVTETGTLPEIDDKVQVPEGVNMRETYSVGAEWLYSGLAKCLPRDWSLAERVRWVSTVLFSLAIPFATIWVWRTYQSIFSGLVAGLFLAVSPAFSVRSSGLELSRENLAIPLFTLFLMAEQLFRTHPARKVARTWAIIGAISLALAQCTWDLTQYVTGLWVVWGVLGRVMARQEKGDERFLLTAVSLTQILASVLNPYLRVHASFFSPVMALLLARTAMAWFPRLRHRGKLLAFPMFFLALWWVLGHFFVENYSHFGELVFAKIRFLNQKPADPGLLSYAQRIMWTPALNSSTWLLTKLYFPILLPLFGIAVLLLIRGMKRGRCKFQPEFFYAGFTWVVYVFFFRFHVFLVLFLAACVGRLFATCSTRTGFWSKWAFPSLALLLFIGSEFYFLLFFEPKPARNLPAEQQQLQQLLQAMGRANAAEMPKGNRWGRPGAAYGDVESLCKALVALPESGPVLANFGISASILAETELPIILHPKFETPGIRERVREFYQHLFLSSEKELRDWAVYYGAMYYVHSNGNFSDLDPANSPRYMVDALEPPAEAAVYMLENNPADAVWFRPVYSNRRYRIYRIVTPEDEEIAEQWTRMGIMAFESGDIETARKRAMQALSHHWKYPPAKQLLQRALSQPQS